MKKKHDPKSVILTIILIITYALSVVFNFSHMMDGKGSRKPGFATAGLFLLAAFVYIVFKRMNKRPLVVGTVFWSISLVCSAYALMMCFFYNDLMSLFYPLMMLSSRRASASQRRSKRTTRSILLSFLQIPAAELIFHIILLALRSKKVKK